MASDILLLGSTGFIGNFISKHFDCYAISRRDFDFRDFDSLYQYVKWIKPNTIINCVSNTNTQLSPFEFSAFYENLELYYNLYRLRDEVGQVIHFGSGAEFDRSTSIDNAPEASIFDITPKDHYGLSKNIIARNIHIVPNFYNLRLFGCFHGTEKNRLLSNLIKNETNYIKNRYFDYFWLEDIIPIIEHYLNPNSTKIKDLNLVYDKKYLISDFIDIFLSCHTNINTTIWYENDNNNYTGSSTLIDSLGLTFGGIKKGIERYFG